MQRYRRHQEGSTDVLIAGGGPAGCALAIAAAGSGLSVLVLERSRYGGPRVGEHLTPDAQPTLEALGLFERFHAASHQPCLGIRAAWGTETLYDRDYLFNVYGHGWNLDRQQFDAMLAEAAEKAGAVVLTSAQLAAFEACNGGWRTRLKGGARDGHTIVARFLVDATGRAAALARRLGSQRLARDKLVGLCAWLPSQEPGDGAGERLLIEAIETGWWYTTRLPGDRCVAGLLSDHDLVPSGMVAAATAWTEQLARTRHVKALIGGYGPVVVWQRRSANSSILAPMTGEHWLAVGDAASAFDPLSSTGILKALQSGMAAASAIVLSLAGDRNALSAYAREVTREFAGYLDERQFFYAREQRWPEEPFWQRRYVAPQEGVC